MASPGDEARFADPHPLTRRLDAPVDIARGCWLSPAQSYLAPAVPREEQGQPLTSGQGALFGLLAPELRPLKVTVMMEMKAGSGAGQVGIDHGEELAQFLGPPGSRERLGQPAHPGQRVG